MQEYLYTNLFQLFHLFIYFLLFIYLFMYFLMGFTIFVEKNKQTN